MVFSVGPPSAPGLALPRRRLHLTSCRKDLALAALRLQAEVYQVCCLGLPCPLCVVSLPLVGGHLLRLGRSVTESQALGLVRVTLQRRPHLHGRKRCALQDVKNQV